MAEKVLTKLEVVHDPNPAKFQELFNSKMKELANFNPEFMFISTDEHCAYITYSYTEKIIGKVEPYRHNTCGTCGHAEKPRSDRVKWRRCGYFGAVNCNREACQHYYPEVEYGN